MKLHSKIFKISILKTLYFNYHYFGLKGIFILPCLIGKHVEFKNLKGSIICKHIKTGIFQLGINKMDAFPDRTVFVFDNNGKIFLNGSTRLGVGVKISNHGELHFGDEDVVTASSQIICMKKISFGNNVLISWNCQITDTDFHKIYDMQSKEYINPDKDIIIGNNIWIGSGVSVNKGVSINDNVIIASGSRIRKDINQNNVIVGDLNKILKENVSWEK